MGPFYAIVLAAGASERLGQPKAMVKVGERKIPLVKWVVERLERSGISPIVVTNQELLIPITFAIPDRTVVLNSAPEKGRTGSIQCGLATIIDKLRSKQPMRVLIAPVDRPGFSASTLEVLRHTEHTACPAKDGRGGHPVLITAEDVKRIMAAEPSTSLRELISPMRVNVVDEHLHFNLDTTDDLEQLDSVINSFDL
jgi:molybdenum cofactor cytidylyltransferase